MGRHPPPRSTPSSGKVASENRILVRSILLLIRWDSSYHYGINDGGQVVGTTDYQTSHLYMCAFPGKATTGMQNIGTLGDDLTWANDINNTGQVVGAGCVKPYDTTTPSSGKPTAESRDLNTLIPSSPEWTLWEANAINDNGWIVGPREKS